MKRALSVITVALLAMFLCGSAAYRRQYVGYLTWHNDNTNQGQITTETVLTPANVLGATFKKVWSFTSADGQIYTQPLVVKNVLVSNVLHNVLYFASQNNTVYALDADTGSSLWSVTVNAGEAAATQTDITTCNDITPQIGVTSTPVIDPATGIMYVVAQTEVNSTTYNIRLHALDIRTGAEVLGGPVAIAPSVSGTGSDSSGGLIGINKQHNLNRSALRIWNGILYIAFASHCDDQPYHGWIIGYDVSTLSIKYAWANAANATNGEGGIWMSGAGPAITPGGHLYVVTGNVAASAQYSPGTGAYSNSVIKFNKDLTIADYFTPNDQPTMDNSDLDLGSSGILLLPDQPGAGTMHGAAVGGKEPHIWVVNRDNLGHQSGSAGDPQIPQRISNAFGASNGGTFSNFAYWNGRTYFCQAPLGFTTPQSCTTRNLTNGQIGSVQSTTTATFEFPGAHPFVTSNGTTNGILWVYRVDATAAHAHLYAYDATNITTPLWDSEANAARDACGMAGIKFQTATVYNGKVYIGGASGVCAYANF